MEGTLSEAIQAVSTMEIVRQFDVPFQQRNGKVYLICPGHDDSHFGSCYIDKNDNGYYCYACNEHVDKWNMLLKVSGYSHRDAAKWFFETSGITPSSSGINPLASINKLIAQVSKFCENSPIYNDLYDCKKLESSYGRIINGSYLFSEVQYGNPLLELYKQDKDLFQKIVLNVLGDREKRLKVLAKECLKPNFAYKGIKGDILLEGIKKELDEIEFLTALLVKVIK